MSEPTELERWNSWKARGAAADARVKTRMTWMIWISVVAAAVAGVVAFSV